MAMKVFSVYDCKAEAFIQPFFCVNRAVALRNFMTAASSEGHDFHTYAADYTLFEIGEWDETSGRLEQYDVSENLGTALQYIGNGTLREVKSNG